MIHQWDHGLGNYKKGVIIQLEGYIDANWADSVSARWSTSDFVFSLRNGVILWSSKKQLTVTLLSTEVEYRGAAIATCEVIWLKRLLKDFNESVNELICIYCNQSSIQLAPNTIFHARTKHIEVHYHYIRKCIIAGDIDLLTSTLITRLPISSPRP